MDEISEQPIAQKSGSLFRRFWAWFFRKETFIGLVALKWVYPLFLTTLKIVRYLLSKFLIFIIALILFTYGWRNPTVWDNLFSSVKGTRISFDSVVQGLLFFLATLYLTRVVKYFIRDRVLSRTNIDVAAQSSIVTIIGYVGGLVALLVGLSIMGLDFKNLAIVFGALSVGIGFGLQNIVNNFVSGLLILFERPIKEGDWVVVGGNEGIVRKINIRSTEIETFDKASILIPNANILSTDLTNWTHSDMYGRVIVPVGVSYDSDVKKVRQILLDCAAQEPQVLSKPAPYVWFTEFADNSLNFELRCIVQNVMNKGTVKSNLMFSILDAFNKEGIEIPFPQRVVHFADRLSLIKQEEEKPLTSEEKKQIFDSQSENNVSVSSTLVQK